MEYQWVLILGLSLVLGASQHSMSGSSMQSSSSREHSSSRASNSSRRTSSSQQSNEGNTRVERSSQASQASRAAQASQSSQGSRAGQASRAAQSASQASRAGQSATQSAAQSSRSTQAAQYASQAAQSGSSGSSQASRAAHYAAQSTSQASRAAQASQSTAQTPSHAAQSSRATQGSRTAQSGGSGSSQTTAQTATQTANAGESGGAIAQHQGLGNSDTKNVSERLSQVSSAEANKALEQRAGSSEASYEDQANPARPQPPRNQVAGRLSETKTSSEAESVTQNGVTKTTGGGSTARREGVLTGAAGAASVYSEQTAQSDVDLQGDSCIQARTTSGESAAIGKEAVEQFFERSAASASESSLMVTANGSFEVLGGAAAASLSEADNVHGYSILEGRLVKQVELVTYLVFVEILALVKEPPFVTITVENVPYEVPCLLEGV
ncbi:hypothetical protein NEDG_00167 [Nematocida displodere]|uniref:Uncharacterized protein n=1 Tax=Nematocida displodere TaxID=1805483 RepID=A0A177EKP7_9MICR|nr:hypothetical protein NEDG_00167 [Nematocida displodere]